MRGRRILHMTAAVGLALIYVGGRPDDAGDAWRLVPIPETWKEPPRVRPADDEGSGRDGYAWYRCGVAVPEGWDGAALELFVEPVDDARAAFVNGVQVGAAGTFPPRYRSGLGESGRYEVPEGVVRAGVENVVAVRVYANDGRSNFAVAAPALLASGRSEAIKLEGPWEYRAGDDPDWATGAMTIEGATYGRVDRVDDLDAYLRHRSGDTDPLPPEAALGAFDVAEDLAVDLVLSEPEIAQPLHLSFDARGRLWVVEYRQYPEPAGLEMVSRDKFLRSVYDRVPEPPPRGVPGRDRISIHEDVDGDGTFEHHKTFIDGLNLASSVAVGRGGVWALNPPYLLFYPDEDGDDVPDGDPEVVLEGFGLEDSHSIANSLRWGPDGWLYAAQGSTVTGRVRRPGEPDEAIVHSMGQHIWRYHPESRRYEVFAEGGGNTFGVEIDAEGRTYSGHNGGDTRGFHYVQGGYYQKGFAKHGALSNPYAFGYFPAMGHHSVPRFSHTFIINEGGALPDTYRGLLFGVEPLQGQVVASEISPDGSTFRTRDLGRPLTTEDPWFRPVAISLGPDGALYVADFYEQRIDHSSHYAGRVDRTNGRVYRLRAADAPPGRYPGGLAPQPPFDIDTLPGVELIGLLDHPNRWMRHEALRVLGDRRDEALIPELRDDLFEPERGDRALEILWALNLSGGFDEATAIRLLGHPEPHVRAWTVRLACDDNEAGDELTEALAALAVTEPAVAVRSQLASSSRRLPAAQSLPIARALLEHDEDADDPHLPLLLWWAIEAKVGEDSGAVLALFEEPGFWGLPIVSGTITSRLMQRFASAGTRADLLSCADLLERAPDPETSDLLMAGFEAAFEGRSLPPLPDRLVRAIAESGGGSLPLRVRQGGADDVAEAIEVIADPIAEDERRIDLIRTFGEIRDPRGVPPLLAVAASPDAPEGVRAAAFAALKPFDDTAVVDRAIALHNALPPEARAAAQDLLVGRRNAASAFVDAIDAGAIDPGLVPEASARRILLLGEPSLAESARRIWGDLGGESAEASRRAVGRWEGVIAEAAGNPYNGKALYLEHCGTCHRLFDDGGDVGPNLSSYQRDDLRAMLGAVVDPAAEIREGYETYLALTVDGRVATGFLADRDDRVVVLRGADGRSEVLHRDEIDEFKRVPQSVMPIGLLDGLDEQEVRDLFAYLRSTQPLSD